MEGTFTESTRITKVSFPAEVVGRDNETHLFVLRFVLLLFLSVALSLEVLTEIIDLLQDLRGSS